MTPFRYPRALAIPALLLAVACGETEVSIPVRTCEVALTYAPQLSVQGAVSVIGEWDGFSTTNPLKLQDRGDGVFTARLEGLEPRDYGYRFVLGEKQLMDPQNPYTRWVRAEEYSRLTVPDCRQPVLELRRFSVTPEGRLDLEVAYLDGTDAAGPAAEDVVLSLDGEVKPDAFDRNTGRFTLEAKALPVGKHHVKVMARDAQGRTAAPLYLPFWVEGRKFRWESGMMYFAFTDRFHNARVDNDRPVADVQPIANYSGGDFAGITQKIEEGYFDSLGVRTLWLSPVDQNPEGRFEGSGSTPEKPIFYSGYHGYWPSKPRTTQHRFGSLEELRALTAAAHKRGIRVIADLVLNHVHQEHPYWIEHQGDGWFNTSASCVCGTGDCDWEEKRLTCKFTDYLPDYNWRSAGMVDQFIADALWWLEEADFDGFRMDAVKHMDQVAGRTLRGKLKELTAMTGTEFYLVGETFVGEGDRAQIARYIGADELDGQFDFPLYWPIRNVFAEVKFKDRRQQWLTDLDAEVRANEVFYAPGTINSPFLGNHDVPRFMSWVTHPDADKPVNPFQTPLPVNPVTDPDAFQKVKYAFTFLLTQPGVPLIYYGDEIGMPGLGDPDNRRMMRFGTVLEESEKELLEVVRKLGQARRTSDALQTGERHTLRVENDLYIYQRSLPGGGPGAIVVINRGTVQRPPLEIDLVGSLAAEKGEYEDIFSGRTLELAGTATVVELPPRSVSVYLPKQVLLP